MTAFTQPRRADLCWLCDRKLYASGRSYALMVRAAR